MSPQKSVVEVDETTIDAIFAGVNQNHLPGAAVGIALRGKPVYRKGFGLASLELPMALSPAMRLRIGSTTKQFLALTYLTLCEAGMADMDDPIGRHLPELHPITHPVTIRHLMSNTSGLRDATDLVVQFSGVGGQPVSTEGLLEFYRDMGDVNAAPGSTYLYNNGGWVILGAAIERITQQKLEQVLQERVFGPLGMHDTQLRRSNARFVPNSASSHVLTGAGSYERTEWLGGIDAAGAGAMVSTVDDMLRWLSHMDSPNVGTPGTWEAMKTPQTLPNGQSTGYGLGLQTNTYRGIETLHHPGGVFGANAQMLKVPAAGLDVIVIANRSDISAVELTYKILDACVPNLSIVPPSYEGPVLEGVYRSPTSGRVVQLLAAEPKDGPESAQIVTIDGHRLPCAPDAGGVLRIVTPGLFLKYAIKLIGTPNKAPAIELNDFGNLDRLLSVARMCDDSNRVVGRYRNESSSTEASISRENGEITMTTVGRFGTAVHQLRSAADGIWNSSPEDTLALPPWSVLSFGEDYQSFRFNNVLTRNLEFQRVD